ncbi:hypothetical protein A2757_00515 [Candidatus Giovannonibacteria bacterium RIFCSPHIGHO2_01_FULL_48_47]|nr:MAG: hypothetical protein A2757_00515 [Candidatus Giovannonibacteria bacterium RIFCSPHIGHO2_01_FULL_48_47]OGF69007.1 MAG: hypothetical protein A3D61_00180 [Candidatus Giovannonibacteria bacterium RIFCSPHIGHO2_02_FULL_48_15]OGF88446.1 MAG: hypothetical protein A3B26_00735 [Candidatus Giovannonibacteria bacterium RIFCSPLOWO2_01_FULL_48_47]OGF96085.1 MAG: hypothetical protein A2613_00750 [Candidatus Giovannonibacteria bacterium RIFOXYD1_FULL_48_21]HBT81541.1 hypothetical protein [Candidatus Gio
MKKLGLITFLGIILVASAPAVPEAGAVGLSVYPKELRVSAMVGETANYKLNVKNPSGEVSLFEVYPDDLGAIVKVSPSSFILESEESREVSVRVTARGEGVFKTNISVVATPVASASFNAGSGVKIPVEISVGLPNSWLASIIASLPLSTTSRTLGVILLGLILIAGFFVIRYGVKQIKI